MIQFSTFDATFDPTFADYIVFSDLTAPVGCRMAGTYMAWLSATGWAYYLFSGNTDRDLLPIATGSFEQAGVTLDSWRTAQPTRIIRAGSLTEFDAEVLSSLLVSPAVYILDVNSAGKIMGIRVRVDPTNTPTWRDAANRLNMEYKLFLPKRKHQMA